ncbi:MAG: hypothetical protein ACM3YE_02540 [Bacteroidota bacterium]
MKTFKLSSPFIFDTDCISAFLWVKRLDIPEGEFPGKIKIPDQVMAELANLKKFSAYSWVPNLLEAKIKDHTYERLVIPASGPLAEEYIKLLRKMGSGEAAALSLVKHLGGTVVSSNLRDVKEYCDNNGLELIKTGDILCMAVINGRLSEADGQIIWTNMKKARRRLPDYDFSEELKRFKAE